MLETQFFDFLLPCKGQEAFSWGWPGPLDLECCSCASDSDWRFRFMTSKMQRENPKLVAITAEGNCKLGHKQRRFVTCKDTPAINEQNGKADTFQQILGSGVVRTSAENYAYWKCKIRDTSKYGSVMSRCVCIIIVSPASSNSSTWDVQWGLAFYSTKKIQKDGYLKSLQLSFWFLFVSPLNFVNGQSFE